LIKRTLQGLLLTAALVSTVNSAEAAQTMVESKKPSVTSTEAKTPAKKQFWWKRRSASSSATPATQEEVAVTAQPGGAIPASPVKPERKRSTVGTDEVEAVPPGAIPAGPPVERTLTRAASKRFDLRALPARRPKERERPEHEGPTPNPVLIERDDATAPPDGTTSLRPEKIAVTAPAPIMDFDGLDRQNWGAGSPPDTNGDVGPVYYIQSVNTSVGVYRKSDGFQEAAFTFDTLMAQGNFGNQCDSENFGDPVVLYDTFEDRWILTDFAFTLDGGGNVNPPVAYQCFAVSMTGDPLTGGWNFYSIAVTDALNDYPKLGVWTDGIYMSVNLFGFASGGSFQGVRVWAFNKAQMYAGSPTVQVVSFNVGTGDFTLVPSNARLQVGTPPAGRPNLFLSTWNFLNALTVYKFHVDWTSIGNSTFTGPDVPLAGSSWPNAGVGNAPQTGTATLLDVLQIRAMVQNQYTNIGGAESLWVAHTVRRVNTTGFAAPRWYQVDVTGGAVAANLLQAATWDPDAANVMHRFMPSLAIDRAGNLAMGYSTSNSTTVPAIKYAGRLLADPVNTFSQTEQTLFAGLASQTGSSRWGDYSGMTLDPDGCTFWYTNEYGNTDQAFDKRWRTRINSFRYPSCTQLGAGGTVSGTVIATTGGAPIVGATVQLGARSTTTNSSGQYSFLNIPAGTYPSISASFPGYVTSTASDIVVTDGNTTTQNFSLAFAPLNACLTDTTQADFTAGVGTGIDTATNPGDVTLTNAPTVDQSHTAGTTTGTGFSATGWNGQTFIPAVTGELSRVDVQLFCSGCTGTTPNITVSIRATSAGLPAGADLATATIPGFANAAGTFYTATFGSPATLTSGTQYALILGPIANPSPGAGYFWIRASPGTYASGQRVLSADSGGTWSADSTRDYNFRTFISTGYASSGNLVSSSKDGNPLGGLTPIWSTISWTASAPANTALQFQAAGSNSQFGPFNFVGPDGTGTTFFTTSGASLTPFYGMRYLKYKAYLATTDSAATPTLNDVTACFDNVDCSSVVATITPAPTSVCDNSTGNTASGPAGMTSYSWSITNGSIQGSTTSQSITYSAGASGDVGLTLSVTAAGGCRDTKSVNVPILVTPATPTITPGGPTTFCTGGSVTLTSSSATGNQWSLNGNAIGGATSQSYIATATGNYTVIASNGACGSVASAPTAVTINPTPATPTIAAGGPTTFCAGGSVTLTSSSGTGNQWYNGLTLLVGETNQTYNATASGNYNVVVTASGCPSAPSASTTVTVNPIPATPTVTPGGPTTFCAGGSVTLTSSSGTGNQWYNGLTLLVGQTNQTYNATASGNYNVVVTASGCPSAPSASTTVTVDPAPAMPTITPGGPTTFCAGGSVTLTSSSAAGNQWSLNGNPIGGATNQTYVASASGDYSVTTTATGCASTPSTATTVTVNPIPSTPVITPAGPTTFCTGGNVSLSSSSASGNHWFLNGNPIGGATSQAYVATAAGNYSVVVTTSGCSSAPSAAVTVTINPNPNAAITAPASADAGSTGNAASTANAGAGATYTWLVSNGAITAGAGTPAITFTAGAVGTLTLNLTVTTGAGCSDAKSATVTVTNPQKFDPNGDSAIDPSDIFYLVAYLFTGGPAPTGTAGMPSGDSNGDGVVDPADIFYAVNYLFGGGPAPFAKAPGSPVTTSAAPPLAGTLTLGQPVRRDNRWFVPVILTTTPGSPTPQALSLRVHFSGEVGEASVHRGAGREPVFEVTRRIGDAISYLAAFGKNAPLTLGTSRLAVVAELELSADGEVRLEIDPELTMLVGEGGVQKATVANRALQVRGATLGARDSTPRDRSTNDQQ
jgi:hypothetical protein